MKFSFFKNGIKNKKISLEIGLDSAFKIIRNGDYRQDVERLRAGDNKSVQSAIKKQLAYFTFSGTFRERNVEGLLKHSGYMIVDFDLNGEQIYNNGETKEKVLISEHDVEKVKYILSLDPHTRMLFISPSGNGLKVIVQIDPERHADSFTWLETYYAATYGLEVDPSGKDVSRACFVSWDPYVFMNPEAVQIPVSTPVAEAPRTPAEKRNYKIDYDTGEVLSLDEVPENLRKEYDRAVQTVNRICEAQKDICSQYNDWVEIGMALSVFGEPGRDLYHKVSQFYPGYSAKETDEKFTNYLKTSKFTSPAKFFKTAREYKIDTRFIRTIQAASAEGSEGREYEDYSYYLPDGEDITPELKQHNMRYGFIEYKGKYCFPTYSKGGDRSINFTEISNFVIIPQVLIISKAEPKRIVEIRNIYGISKTLDIPTKAFVSIAEFYAFVESQGNFLMDATKSQFLRIKAKLYNETINAEEIKTLGWHRDGFYAWANGIYTTIYKGDKLAGRYEPTDDHGVVEFTKQIQTDDGNKEALKKYYFIPALSSIYRDEDDEFESQKKFVYMKPIRDAINLRDWATAFIDVYKDNGRIGLLYYITSLFRDIVYDRFKYFPHLFLFGPPGSGKSTMAWSFMAMFGEQQLPFNLNGGTRVAFHKKFATFRNSVIWFDEYANSIDLVRIQAMKAAYDGTGHEKSEMTSANRTKTTPVNSACLISGQELPIADNALFKRVILLQYNNSVFTQQDKDMHKRILDIEKLGVSHFTAAITTLRPVFESKFFPEYDTQLKAVKTDLARESVEERLIQHAALLLASFNVLQPTLNLPVKYEEMKDIFLNQIRGQNSLVSSSKETSTFWDLVEFMLDKGEREGIKAGREFKIVTGAEFKVSQGQNKEKIITFLESDGKTKTTGEVLFLRLSKIHPLYLTFHRQQLGKTGMDKNSLIHYLSNHPSYLGTTKGTRFDDCNTSAFAFDYRKLEDEGLNLKRIMGDDNDEGQELTEATTTTTSDNAKADDDLPF